MTAPALTPEVSARRWGVADTRGARAVPAACHEGLGRLGVSMLRRWGCRVAVALACLAAPAAHAQPGSIEMPPAEDDAPPTEVRPGGASCGTINARAMEATLVIRQHASALSVGIDADSRPQGIVLLAYLDQWAGRLRGLVDLGEFTECLDDGEAETYRRALATATRVGNQAREELFRAPRAQQPQQQQRNRRF